MIHVRHFLRPFALSLGLVLGCTGTGMAGCGSDSPTISVESGLTGIYDVTLYQSDPQGCDNLADSDQGPARIVIFALPDETQGDAKLVGRFCGSVEDCRSRISDAPTAVNYAFIQGSDTAGWIGYGVESQSMVGEQCQVGVQEHRMTSTGDSTVRIDTRVLETLHDGQIEGEQATCVLRDAIDSITNETPCTGAFRLDGNRVEAL